MPRQLYPGQSKFRIVRNKLRQTKQRADTQIWIAKLRQRQKQSRDEMARYNDNVLDRVGNRPSVTRHRPNRRPRFFDVVSSRRLISRTKGYFVRLFVRPQGERRYDRCWLWISTNSIVSIRTTSSKSTKNFGRCRVFSYFQYILCVTGYIWKHHADDTIPVTKSREYPLLALLPQS